LRRRMKAAAHAEGLAQAQKDKAQRKEAAAAQRIRRQAESGAARGDAVHAVGSGASEAVAPPAVSIAVVPAAQLGCLSPHLAEDMVQVASDYQASNSFGSNSDDPSASSSDDDSEEAQNEGHEEDATNALILAPPPPSDVILLGHLPAPFPPEIPGAAAAAPSAPSAADFDTTSAVELPGFLTTTTAGAVPASLRLSAAEERLLRWHFQAVHHGVQPVLVGACRRHCKQMFKSDIDHTVREILQRLTELQHRAKTKAHSEAEAAAAAVKDLPATSKGKNLLAPAVCERTEAGTEAVPHGLDPLRVRGGQY
jgi:hypothetical protein